MAMPMLANAREVRSQARKVRSRARWSRATEPLFSREMERKLEKIRRYQGCLRSPEALDEEGSEEVWSEEGGLPGPIASFLRAWSLIAVSSCRWSAGVSRFAGSFEAVEGGSRSGRVSSENEMVRGLEDRVGDPCVGEMLLSLDLLDGEAGRGEVLPGKRDAMTYDLDFLAC